MMNRGVNLGTISIRILSHSNFQYTAVYCQTMPQTVELAVQDHSRFLLGGGGAEVKAAIPVSPAAVSRPPTMHATGWSGRDRAKEIPSAYQRAILQPAMQIIPTR